MKIRPPSGYLALQGAQDLLRQNMYEGIPPSEATQFEGVAVVDSKQAVAAAKYLRQAIISQELDLFALFSSRRKPTRLHDQALIEAAFFPRNSTVITFQYMDRNPRAPFGLPWTHLKELTRNPLCVEKKAFQHWLKKQAREKAWPCHQLASERRRRRGRPTHLIDNTIEVIEQLGAQRKVKPTMKLKELHAAVQRACPALRDISPATVGRARKQTSY